jgi:copper chaperone CopZ
MTIQPIRLTTFGEAAANEAGACGCDGGSCAVPASASVAGTSGSEAASASVDRDVLVQGMTCDHCVRAVSTELGSLDGVDRVTVALNPGGASRVSFRAPADLADATVRAAIEEAGYQPV